MSERVNLDSTWKRREVPRGKHHNKTATKTTVSLYLSKNLVKNARKQGLNLSRIMEQALSSIVGYLKAQKGSESAKCRSASSVLNEGEWAGSSVWYECRLRKAEAAGSNPARSIESSFTKEASPRKRLLSSFW
jgi:post-segregation antitoxin (ccd killing protein)